MLLDYEELGWLVGRSRNECVCILCVCWDSMNRTERGKSLVQDFSVSHCASVCVVPLVR